MSSIASLVGIIGFGSPSANSRITPQECHGDFSYLLLPRVMLPNARPNLFY